MSNITTGVICAGVSTFIISQILNKYYAIPYITSSLYVTFGGIIMGGIISLIFRLLAYYEHLDFAMILLIAAPFVCSCAVVIIHWVLLLLTFLSVNFLQNFGQFLS